MAQSYVDNETMMRFQKFFEGEDEKDLKEQMDNMAKALEGHATLEAEAVGETLEAARSKLREQIKKDLYGGKEDVDK